MAGKPLVIVNGVEFEKIITPFESESLTETSDTADDVLLEGGLVMLLIMKLRSLPLLIESKTIINL